MAWQMEQRGQATEAKTVGGDWGYVGGYTKEQTLSIGCSGCQKARRLSGKGALPGRAYRGHKVKVSHGKSSAHGFVAGIHRSRQTHDDLLRNIGYTHQAEEEEPGIDEAVRTALIRAMQTSHTFTDNRWYHEYGRSWPLAAFSDPNISPITTTFVSWCIGGAWKSSFIREIMITVGQSDLRHAKACPNSNHRRRQNKRLSNVTGEGS